MKVMYLNSISAEKAENPNWQTDYSWQYSFGDKTLILLWKESGDSEHVTSSPLVRSMFT